MDFGPHTSLCDLVGKEQELHNLGSFSDIATTWISFINEDKGIQSYFQWGSETPCGRSKEHRGRTRSPALRGTQTYSQLWLPWALAHGPALEGSIVSLGGSFPSVPPCSVRASRASLSKLGLALQIWLHRSLHWQLCHQTPHLGLGLHSTEVQGCKWPDWHLAFHCEELMLRCRTFIKGKMNFIRENSSGVRSQ